MALTLGELSGIISLDEKPAMTALGKVRQGMRDTASEGQKSTDKMQAQQAKFAAAVENASAQVSRARQREKDAADAVRVAEMRLADAKKKGADGSAAVVAAQNRVNAAHGRVRAAQDATAKSTRDLEMAQTRLAATSDQTAERTTASFGKMGNSGNRTSRTLVRAFGLITVGLTGVVPAAGAGGAALVAMAGSALTLAGSVKQLVGVAALVPAALFAVGSGAGVLMSAFSGMGEALKTATEESGAAAGNAKLDAMTLADAARAVAQAERTAAEQQVSSARRVEDAKRALSRVVEDNAEQQAAALRRVAYAERDVESANRRVEDSQRDLNDARKDAVEQLKDLQFSVVNAAFSERDAVLQLEDAQKAWNDALTTGADTNSREMRGLHLEFERARFQLIEAKKRTEDLSAEEQAARKAGVDGNRRVEDAQQSLTDAQQASLDAVTARAKAVAEVSKVELEGAERIADAQRDIADAAEESAKAQVQAAESVADAHRNLERVQLQQADAAAKATEKSVEAMAGLTPTAQVAAAALLVAYGRLGDVRDIAQENFFTGFSDPLLALVDTVIPQLERGVGRLATAYGAGAQTWLRALDRELGNGVLERMFDRSTEAAYILNDAIDPIVGALVTLTDVGMEYMPRLAGGIRDAATEFDAFIQQAANDGSLRMWIDNGIEGTKDLFSILGSTLGILDKLEDAARAGGIATTLSSVADGLDRIETTAGGQVFQSTLATIFSGARGGAEGLLAALGPIGEAFRVGGPALAEFLRLGGEIAGTFVGSMFTGLSDPNFGSGLTTFLTGVQDGVEVLGPKLPGLFEALGGILEAVAPVVEAFGPTAVEVLTAFAEGFGAVLGFLEPVLTGMAGSPVAVGILLGVLGAAATLNVISTFAGAIGGVTTAFKLMWAAASGPVGWIVAGVAVISAAWTYFLTETETGQKLVKDSSWALYEAWNTTSILFDSVVKPRFTKASADVVSGFLGIQRDGGIALAALQTTADRTSLDVVADFLGMKNGATGYMADLVTGVLGGKKDLETAFLAIDTALQKVPGYFDAAKTGAMLAFNKMKDEAKVPIRFVVDDVLGGMVEAFWKIPGLNEGNLPKPKLPKGFRHGGYTGDGGVDEAAGVVHGKEFVFTAAQTKAIGKENLAAAAHAAVRGGAASDLSPMAGQQGFFTGNVSQIARHKSLYMDVASGMGPWDFPGAAKMWDGAAGVKVAIGRGQHQGHARPLERGGGILGYATGTNIDMSPSWMGQLSASNRRKTAAHELGHVLGLPHFTGVNSIMDPYLGNQAATPTPYDIRALQKLYPGGSGEAGDGAVTSPFDGLIDTLMGEFKKTFPGGGMFVDATGGIAKQGMGEVVKWISDIKNGIGDIAGDVVGNIRDFFGGGSSTMTPTLMDGGGWLHDTDGPQIVDHRRKKPDAFTPYDEWQQMKRDFAGQAGGGALEGNLYLDSGEFLGRVRGEVRKEIKQQVGVSAGRRVGV